MGLDSSLVEAAEVAGSLMNLGKIKVPTEVLTKREKLTDEEMQMIRNSVFASADLIRNIEFDGPVEETLRQLQEQYDGSGGPKGLKIGRATSELQSPMRTSYAVFCLTKNKY